MEYFRYENHVGEALDFGSDGLLVNQNDLRDYSWSVVSANNKISGFNRKIQSKKVPVIIVKDSASETAALKNKLFNVIEKDVLAMQEGKIIIGDYYLKGYFAESTKKEYAKLDTVFYTTLKYVTDKMWTKDQVYYFGSTSSTVESTGIDYPYDYSHDFGSDISQNEINNSSLYPCEFKIQISGLAINPEVYINGHLYKVNVVVNEGETLVIDSASKKIFKITSSGNVNVFSDRERSSYIFEKIEGGKVSISADDDLIWSLTLLDERSEPVWI